jgi:D-3-phosphoglycerate dehydrogenase
MLVVHNEDSPGVIGLVATALGTAGVNISDMDVGQTTSGVAALMVIATGEPVPASVVAEISALPVVQSARAFDLT